MIRFGLSSILTRLWAGNSLFGKTVRNSSSNIPENVIDIFSKFKGGEVVLEQNDETGIAKIRFSNEEKKNAFTGKMMIELLQAVESLHKWKQGRFLILHSTGNLFCSGADLGLHKDKEPEVGRQMSAIMHQALNGITHLPLLTVALIQGKAIGGGAELTMACDFRIMTPGASIQFVHARLGIMPGWGGGTRLVHLLGAQQALKLLAESVRVNTQQALTMGLINYILKSEENRLEETEVYLNDCFKCSKEVIKCLKEMIRNATDLKLKESLLKEKELFGTLWGGPAQKEALRNKNKR